MTFEDFSDLLDHAYEVSVVIANEDVITLCVRPSPHNNIERLLEIRAHPHNDSTAGLSVEAVATV